MGLVGRWPDSRFILRLAHSSFAHEHTGRAGARRPGRALLASLLFAALAGSLAAGPADASSGTLILTSDTTLTEDHHGRVLIEADGVTLDCAGHRILGSGDQAGIFIQDRVDITVRNCETVGFLNGVLVDQSSQVRLEGNRSSENDYGFAIYSSDHVRAEGNVARGNTVFGFSLVLVTDSWLSGNQGLSSGLDGFHVGESDGNVLFENSAEDNAERGFYVIASQGNALEANVARRNGSGFVVEDSSGGRLTSNLGSENRLDGFRFWRVFYTRVAWNTAVRNDRDGFRFEQSGDLEFFENVALENGAYELVAEETTGLDLPPALSPGDTGGPGLPYAHELLSFLGLASTIWLGVYLVGRPRRTPAIWLTALSLWSLAGVFLDDFMDFNQPAVGFLQQFEQWLAFWPGANELLSQLLLLGWVSKFAVILWFHATSLMLPGGLTRARRVLVLIGYGLAAVTVVIQLLVPGWLAPGSGSFPIFAGALLGYLALCLANLVEAIRRARSDVERRQFTLLLTATILACLSGLAYLVGESLGGASAIARTALLWLAVVPLGYGVANYSAIVEGRTVRRHFTYSLVAVSLVTLLYFVVAYVSSVSFGVRTAAFAFVILLAVVTHSLVGNARAILDYFFVDPETRKLLEALRRLPNNLTAEGQLEERLGLALDVLCTRLRASYGVVLLVSERTLHVAAGYRWSNAKGLPLPREAVAVDDIVHLDPGRLPPPLEGAALLAPIRLEAEYLGSVVLGHPVNATRFAPEDLDVAGYATDRMAEIIRLKRLEDEAYAHLRQVPMALGQDLSEGEPSIATVEGALRQMRDLTVLGDSPLAGLRAVKDALPAGSGTTLERGAAVHQVLAQAIEKLKPGGEQPTGSSPKDWDYFMVLHEAYVMKRPNREVRDELHISEGTFSDRRRKAIAAVTRTLREQEEAAVKRMTLE